MRMEGSYEFKGGRSNPTATGAPGLTALFGINKVEDEQNIRRLHLSPMLLWFLALHSSGILFL